MNEFTKEELIDLNIILSVWIATKDNDKFLKSIQDKIIFFIDNYCDHEWGVGFGSIHSPVTYCKRCHCQKPLIPNDVFIKMIEIENDNQ